MKARRAACGTDSGYFRHLRTLGEPACRACMDAHRDAYRRRHGIPLDQPARKPKPGAPKPPAKPRTETAADPIYLAGGQWVVRRAIKVWVEAA